MKKAIEPVEKPEEPLSIPTCFRVDALEEGPVKAAMGFLERQGRKPGEFLGLRLAAWEAFKCGNGPGLARDLAALRMQRLDFSTREVPPRVAGEFRSAAEALGRKIADMETLLAAIPAADRVDYRAQCYTAKAEFDRLERETERIQRAGFPVPVELQEKLMAAWDAFTSSDAAFVAQGKRLDGLILELGKQIAAMRANLAEKIRDVKLGQVVLLKIEIAKEGSRLVAFPERLSQEGRRAIAIAREAAALEDGLTGRIDALGGFIHELGKSESDDLVLAVLRLRPKAGPEVRRSRTAA